MKVKFVFNEIKDISKVYTQEITSIPWFDNAPELEHVYRGKKYCDTLIEEVKESLKDIKEVVYKGQIGRIANEMYSIKTEDTEYIIEFTIDTYEYKRAKIMVTISDCKQYSSNEEYDLFLEKMKIEIKNLLKNDWKSCVWILDEQSQYLCAKLYVKIFDIENRIRAFANRVLIDRVGLDWIKQNGLEKFRKSQRELSEAFKRKAPCFADIDDTFIAMTMETMFDVILKGKIYERNIELTSADYEKLHTKIAEGNANSILEILRERRKISVDLWKDAFQRYFEDEEEAKKVITTFIKNRNHVAHNKLLDLNAYKLMSADTEKMCIIINRANEIFEKEMPSEEQYMTWEAEAEENERAEYEEDWKRNYLRNRIEAETGVEIRDVYGIFELFEETIEKLYTELDDEYYFERAVSMSKRYEMKLTEDEQLAFEITGNVVEGTGIAVYVECSFDESMDGDSMMTITVRKLSEEQEIICGADVKYHNGSGYEDENECVIMLESDSEYDESELVELKDEIGVYIAEELNPLIGILKELKRAANYEGGPEPVADFTCDECGKNGISILKKFYPVGRCCYCGTDNNVAVCSLCGKAFYNYDMREICKECQGW